MMDAEDVICVIVDVSSEIKIIIIFYNNNFSIFALSI